MKVRGVIKIIENDGWFQVRQKGCLRQFNYVTKKGTVTFAGHPADGLDKGTEKSILKQPWLKYPVFTN